MRQSLAAPYITASTRVCSAAPGDKCGVTLEWDTGSTQPKSRIFRRQNGGSWSSLTCVAGARGSVGVNDLTVGTTYDFALRAVNSSCGGSTNIAQTTVRVSDSMVTSLKTQLRYQGKAYRDVGMMKLDLFEQFLGVADAPLSQAYDALDKAALHGVKAMTVLAAPWWPVDLAIWQNNPTQYWAAFDTMLAAADAKGIKIVPVIWPNAFVFADYAGRPLSDTFATTAPPAPAVWSRALLLQYASDVATRYANDTRVLYWNLAFQLNLRADTNHALWPSYQVNTDKGTPSSRTTADNFTTDQMIGLMNQLATTVRTHDPNHLIASGYGPPKKTAAGFRVLPEWSGGPAWPEDTQAQMASYLADTHGDPIDIVGIELTNAPSLLEPYMPTNQVLGYSGAFNPDVLGAYQAASDAIGKPLAISMFWDSNPTVSQDARANFTRRALLDQVERAVPISFVNTWMSYLNLGGQLVPWASSLEPTTGPSQMNDLIDGIQIMSAWSRSLPGTRSTRLVVPNADFESGSGTPTDWTLPSGSATLGQLDASSAFQGSRSARLVPGSGLESTLIDAKGLDLLALSAAISYPTTPSGTITMELVELDWQNPPTAITSHTLTLDLADGGGYRVEGLSASLDADTYKVRLRFRVSGSAGLVVNVDDVRLFRLPATGESCPLNGSFDTCTSQCPCKWGWGDCESDQDCAAGLVCATNKGAAFGFDASFDMCLPSHCTNSVRDAPLGETGIDSGAPCGEAPPTLPANVPKYGMGAVPGYGSSVAFAKQHSSLLFIPQPEVITSPTDDSWPAPLIRFAGPTKSYAQYRKLLAEGTPDEQQWLATLDGYRRRVGRHPSFLYAELNSYRTSPIGIHPHRITPPRPFGGTDFPPRFQAMRRLLTTACCQGLDYAACDANQTLCTMQSLASYQAPDSQTAVANLARFYVEHFEPKAFAPFAEMNYIKGPMEGISDLGSPSGGEWVMGLLPTYAKVVGAVKNLYTERGLTPIPVFPSWQWEAGMIAGNPLRVTQAAGNMLLQVYQAAPFDYIGISTYPAGWMGNGLFPVDGFLSFQAHGAAYYTSVHDVFAPNGLQIPLAIAETSWPGEPALLDAAENQRAYYEWMLGPENDFEMVMSYLGVDPRVGLAHLNQPCDIGELPMGSVTSAAHGMRARASLYQIDAHVYSAARDSDADGKPDSEDNCPFVPNPNQNLDDDHDGVGNVCDNCKSIHNPDQFDGDLDGYGNACDADFNGDGVRNQADLDILNARIAEYPSSGCTNPAYNNPALDLNGDFAVDDVDRTEYWNRPSSTSGQSGWACAGSVECPRLECAANPADTCAPQ